MHSIHLFLDEIPFSFLIFFIWCLPSKNLWNLSDVWPEQERLVYNQVWLSNTCMKPHLSIGNNRMIQTKRHSQFLGKIEVHCLLGYDLLLSIQFYTWLSLIIKFPPTTASFLSNKRRQYQIAFSRLQRNKMYT